MSGSAPSADLAWSIRAAEASDVPRLAELEAGAFADPWPPHLLAVEMCHPYSLMLVAAAVAAAAAEGPGEPAAAAGPAGAALGFATFRAIDAEAELLRVAVEPAARGRGIARHLIADGLERLRTAGVTVCYLEVRPNNDSALAVYRALGFEAWDRRSGYYSDGTDALVLRRTL